MKKYLFYLFLFCISSICAQQSSWKIMTSKSLITKEKIQSRKSSPKYFDLFTLDIENFKQEVAKNDFISIPNHKGGFSKFRIKESSNFDKQVSKTYGNISSYSIYGITDQTASGKISIGLDGVHVIVFSAKHSTFFIDPYTTDKSSYITYQKSDLEGLNDEFKCLVEANGLTNSKNEVVNAAKMVNNGDLYTYRLALACTGEYAQFHIDRAGLSNTATDAVKKGVVLSAMNTTMARVNGIFEKDLGVKMEIVLDNNGENELIFLDPENDDLTNNDAGILLQESQTVCDDIIGTGNYDIGHTFSTGAGGLAVLGGLCASPSKARGVTGTSSPTGDSFSVDFVAHELGHQFGANHTFNNGCDGNRNNLTAVEPGSGSTIMGYAGICDPNIQNNSDDYFHAVSIDQMWSRIQSATCGVLTTTNNLPPIVNAGGDVSVPKSTPLVLKGQATDANGDNLTYCWEQTDAEISTMPPLASNLAGPAFRSLPPTTAPNRYLPSLETVISGSLVNEWEVIPSVAREMNFSLLVRDNNEEVGAFGQDEMVVDVIDIDPFVVTSQNSAALTWEVGSTQTITWDVSATDEAPINCDNVTIKLSSDGGVTFPVILAESTPNDGSFDAIVPFEVSSEVRIMVEAVDNIFYNVNTTNFSIVSTEPTFLLSNESQTQEACANTTSTLSYDVNVSYINGYNETVDFSIEDIPPGLSASLSTTSTTTSDNITVTLSGIQSIATGTYSIKLAGVSSSINSTLELPSFTVLDDQFETTTLVSPSNNFNELNIQNVSFNWLNSDDNATAYNLQVALDPNFNDIVINEEDITSDFFALNELLDWSTTYYWRVQPKNLCGEGSYSDIFTFTTLNSFYCLSNFTLVTGGEYIDKVSIDSFVNESGSDEFNAVADGYENFTNLNIPLVTGSTFTLSVDVDPVGFQDHCYAFIDWNNNFVFENDTERYDLGSAQIFEGQANRIITLETDITIPVNTPLTDIRMRIVIEYFDGDNAFGEGPCDDDHNTEFGETEDYTLTIIEDPLGTDAIFNNFSMFPNPASNNFNVLLSVPNVGTAVTLNLFDFTGKLVKSQSKTATTELFSDSINTQDLASGIYVLHIINGNVYTSKKLIVE